MVDCGWRVCVHGGYMMYVRVSSHGVNSVDDMNLYVWGMYGACIVSVYLT